MKIKSVSNIPNPAMFAILVVGQIDIIKSKKEEYAVDTNK